MENQKAESGNVVEVSDKATSVNPVGASYNFVLRKLLRGRRYFEPHNSFGRICNRCGDEDHTGGKCTAAKLRKPCYKCGRRNHNASRCSKRKACLICKKGGHRAKDCPEKHPGPQDAESCLRCGDGGHSMLSCRSIYSVDDVKDIQCYICRNLGHLCCMEYSDSGPAEESCYRCGKLGHTGLACSKSSVAGSRTACYKCGEEGHFAHKCPRLTEVNERKTELDTPEKRCFTENKPESVTLPNDCNVSLTNKDSENKRSKSVADDMGWDAPAPNSKHQSGWTMNDHVISNGSECRVDI